MAVPVLSSGSRTSAGRAILSHWVARLLTLLVVFVAITAGWFVGAAQVFGRIPVLPGLVGITIAAFAAVVMVTRLIERRPLAAIGLGPRGMVREWLGGFGIGVAFLVVCVGALALLGGYRVTGVSLALAPLALALLTQLLVGLWEELLFRGMLFRLLEEGLGSWAALLLSAALFGAVHLSNPNATLWGAAAIGIEAGLMLGAAYMLTRSLWVVAGLHTGWNFFQSHIFGSAISGGEGEAVSLFRGVFSGPELLSGGAFGIEASLIAVLIGLGLALWFVAQAIRRSRTLSPLLWRGGINTVPDGSLKENERLLASL